MAPKKKSESKEEPPENETDGENGEPEEPEPVVEIFKKCFRMGGQLYYGDCKVVDEERKDAFLRHGFGRQVYIAVTPAGARLSDNMSYETVVVGSYEGNFEEDLMTGQGLYKWSDGSSYEGEFLDGQLTGHGRYVWPDGTTYEGEWQAGALTGQGRLDSRFDGESYEGKFHRNCFQAPDGRWVDMMDKVRGDERQHVLEGGAGARAAELEIPVFRCAFGEFYEGQRQEVMEEQKQALFHALQQIQSEGLVPFVVAEAELKGGPLQSLRAAEVVTDPGAQAVSIRLAAVRRRRHRECHQKFFTAIQHSLRSGTTFAMVLEDDDGGCALQHQEQGDWIARVPTPGVPTGPVPAEWKLPSFFLDTCFPALVFRPTVFNGRGLARAFLPEAAQGGPVGGLVPPAAEHAAAASPPPASAADGEPEPTPQQLAAAKAAKGAVDAHVGQTGYFFEVDEGSNPEAVGLPVAHCLRPVVCALGRVPNDMPDSELQGLLRDRFGEHVPMHCVAIVVLAKQVSQQAEPSTWQESGEL